jgi:hypothetical protein
MVVKRINSAFTFTKTIRAISDSRKFDGGKKIRPIILFQAQFTSKEVTILLTKKNKKKTN